MQAPTWVIQREVGSNGVYEAMLAHFKAASIPHHVIKIVPFSHEVEGHLPAIRGPVVCYGSLGMRKVATEQGWAPGVWQSDALGETATLETLGDLYLNDDAQRMRLSKVHDWWLTQGMGKSFFIKPDGDAKVFAGSVMDGTEFWEWDNRLRNVDWFKGQDPLVVVSKPKSLGREWRFVVVGDKISDASLYMNFGRVIPERGAPAKVRAFVMHAHAKNAPAPVYVIDIAETEEDLGQLKVIERNTFNHSGLYGCDVATIVDDINALVRTSVTPVVIE